MHASSSLGTDGARSPTEPAYSRSDIFLRVALFVATVFIVRQLFLLLIPVNDMVIRSAFTTFAGAAGANVLMARLFGAGRFTDFGLGWDGRAGRQLLIGLVAGGGAAVLMLGVPLASGMATLESQPGATAGPWVAALLLLVALAFGSLGEELTFHGYAFQFLLRSHGIGGVFATIMPVSALFGLAHLNNAHITLPALFNTMLFGFVLGFACWRTGALWLSVGVHFGWNLVLPLFGTNLSGFTMGMTGYAVRWKAGDLWSGGEYGPEGGLLCTAAAVAVFLVVRRVR